MTLFQQNYNTWRAPLQVYSTAHLNRASLGEELYYLIIYMHDLLCLRLDLGTFYAVYKHKTILEFEKRLILSKICSYGLHLRNIQNPHEILCFS